MKKIAIAVAVMMSGLNVMAGEVELGAVKAGDISGIPVVAEASIPDAAAAKAVAARMSSKIMVTPTTANWKDTVLIKFARGTGMDMVMHILDSVDLSPAKFFDNGDGYLVRVDIADAKAPARAARSAGFSAVESVQVNRTVYAMLEGGDMKAATAGTIEYYGRGYSMWQPESQGKAEADLRMYVKALRENGITVTDARVGETEGYLKAVVSYQGKEVLLKTTGSAMTLLGAKVKMGKEIGELVSRGAVVIYNEAYKGHDEWSSGGAYLIEYILK